MPAHVCRWHCKVVCTGQEIKIDRPLSPSSMQSTLAASISPTTVRPNTLLAATLVSNRLSCLAQCMIFFSVSCIHATCIMPWTVVEVDLLNEWLPHTSMSPASLTSCAPGAYSQSTQSGCFALSSCSHQLHKRLAGNSTTLHAAQLADHKPDCQAAAYAAQTADRC